ncbi:MAG: aspartyl/asparaginyl beta-hydroxylase domain-containing protein [Halioglobus sp.]
MPHPLKMLDRWWQSFWQPIRRFLAVSRYLYAVRNDPELRQVSRCYIHWLPLNVFSEPVQWLRQLLGTRQRYRLENQRPYDVYVPHLDANPFPHCPDTCALLESRWLEIHAEYLAVAGRQGPPPNQAHVLSGRWGTFDMMAMGQVVDARAQQCPVTMSAVRALPLVDMVTFSSLAPGTRLRPHFGTTNIKLRHQLCLEHAIGARIRVGDQWRSWQQGKCLVIDDSFDHEVVHEGDERRVVLLLDCWHPQLTAKEREFLLQLYRHL